MNVKSEIYQGMIKIIDILKCLIIFSRITLGNQIKYFAVLGCYIHLFCLIWQLMVSSLNVFYIFLKLSKSYKICRIFLGRYLHQFHAY